MKVLFISKHIPYRADSGITVKMLNLLTCLSSVCDVACAYIVDARESNEHALKACKIKAINYLIESKNQPAALKRYAVHLLELFTISGRVKTVLSEIMEKEKPDIVWLEFGYIGHFVPFMKRFGLPVVYASHNSQFKLDFGIWNSTGNIIYRLKMAPFVLSYFIHERLFFRLADLVFCISLQDMSYYSNFISPAKLRFVPFFFDTGNLAAVDPFTADHPYICMVGSLRSYQNYSAAIFAINNVWPILLRENRRIHLYIIGELPEEKSPEYRLMAKCVAKTERIVLKGRVESVIPFVKGAYVSMVPLFIGSGVRTKIIESAACGTPVVSTSIGAEGLPFVDGKSICIADSAETMAEKVMCLVTDSAKRDKIAREAYLIYYKELSCQACRQKIGEIFRELSIQ
ncbi:MAG: glycosyltransferase [Geobacteraceae bacterium]|nr:glycosyltransferase [Geobacteraceae bacterium]